MIRLFASDLDGTLLNLWHSVDKTIYGALEEVISSGAHFAVATGRTMRSSHTMGFEGLACEVVCSNGALVFDRDGQLVHTELLEPAFLEELLRAFPTVPFECVGTSHSYIRGSREAHAEGYKADRSIRRLAMGVVMRGMRGTLSASGEQVFDQTDAQVLSHDVCKVNARVPDQGLAAELMAFLRERSDEVTNAPFNPSMFEITRAGVDKGTAVAWLADYLGIAQDEVAVYGDGGNDVAMLERFAAYGHAYVTHGACDKALAAANAMVGSNVFHAVPRHMLHMVRG